jgi:hypothetical protein
VTSGSKFMTEMSSFGAQVESSSTEALLVSSGDEMKITESPNFAVKQISTPELMDMMSERQVRLKKKSTFVVPQTAKLRSVPPIILSKIDPTLNMHSHSKDTDYYHSIHVSLSRSSLTSEACCPVCLQFSAQPVQLLPCHHHTCHECIRTLLLPGWCRCPICMVRIEASLFKIRIDEHMLR